jgi:hypothetical protein
LGKVMAMAMIWSCWLSIYAKYKINFQSKYASMAC